MVEAGSEAQEPVHTGKGMIHDRQVQTMVGTRVLGKEQNAWTDDEVRTRSKPREGQTHLANWRGMGRGRKFQNRALAMHCIWELIVRMYVKCRC